MGDNVSDMKTAILFTFVAGLLLAAGGPVPRKAGELRIQTAPGKYISLNQYQGKTIILAFILTDCAHCVATTRILNAIQHDYAARNVQVLESANDIMAADRVADFRKANRTIFPVGFNTQAEVAKFLEYKPGIPMLMPGVVFIDRNGMIQAQFDGNDPALETAKADKDLRFTLDETIKAGQATPPPPAQTDKKKP